MRNRSDKLAITIEVSTRFTFALWDRIKLKEFISVDEFKYYLWATKCYLTLIALVNLCDLERILDRRKNDTWSVAKYCATIIDSLVIFQDRQEL